MLDQNALVPKLVTLGLKVKLAIEVLVDFLLLPEVNECAADDTDTTDPLPFVVEPCVLGTTALTETPVTTGALCKNPLPVAGLGVHADWAAIDDAVADQLADLLAGVCHCDGGCFGFIHPDTAKATAENGRGEALLQLERRHEKGKSVGPSKPSDHVWLDARQHQKDLFVPIIPNSLKPSIEAKDEQRKKESTAVIVYRDSLFH